MRKPPLLPYTKVDVNACSVRTRYHIAENLAGENFGDLLQIHQRSFIRQLLVISEKAIEAGLKFAKCNLACYSPKFSPAKNFRYTVFSVTLEVKLLVSMASNAESEEY